MLIKMIRLYLITVINSVASRSVGVAFDLRTGTICKKGKCQKTNNEELSEK